MLTISAVVADLNDDGFVSTTDVRMLTNIINTDAGTVNYREGLDLFPDGDLNSRDVIELRTRFGARNVPKAPTSLTGRVFDNHGNRCRMSWWKLMEKGYRPGRTFLAFTTS